MIMRTEMNQPDLIVAYLFEDADDGENYQDLLRKMSVPRMQTMASFDQVDLPAVWGPHPYAILVRESLDATFPAGGIGRRGSIEWSPRSLKLSSPSPTSYNKKNTIYSI